MRRALVGARRGGCVFVRLEVDPARELELAVCALTHLVTDRRGEGSKVRTCRTGGVCLPRLYAVADGRVSRITARGNALCQADSAWNSVVRVVEDVEALRLEVNLHTLGDSEGLFQGHIELSQRGAI